MRSASLVRTTRPSMQLLACLKRRVSMTLALSTTSIGAVHMTAMQAVNTGSSLTRRVGMAAKQQTGWRT